MTIFSHDGLKDSLTHLAAPPLFYEELRRELSRSERSGETFSLVRLVLQVGTDDQKSMYEVGILNFAETLTRLSRSEDLCARLGEREFVVLLRGPEGAAMNFVARVANTWIASMEASIGDGSYPGFFSGRLISRLSEGPLALLNRLDCEPLLLAGA